MEDNKLDERFIRRLNDNKLIEVKTDGIYGLWVVHPHGLNPPVKLKEARFTNHIEALKAVDKWLDSLKEKKVKNG